MNTTIHTQVIEKFWTSIEKTASCWNWKGFRDKTGLPIIRYGQPTRDFMPRRISLQLVGKTLLSSDRVLPLICKNKLCVNPDHLMFGDEARFWAKVQKLSAPDSCWIWIASQDKDMYGKFRLSEKGKKIDIRAHQYAWQLHTGRPIPKGIQVCHKCDHPYCVNPSHLFIGTTQCNTKDRHEKNRDAKGETHGMSKLAEDQVREIRCLYESGVTQEEIAKQFSVVQSTVSAIVLATHWKHIE